ncbi:MAG TPA: hypothetical protein VF469_24725, partial [Kofleriaceae bacterium]
VASAAEELEPHSVTNSAAISAALLAATVLAGCSLGNTDDEAVGRSAACPSWQLTADAGWSDSA